MLVGFARYSRDKSFSVLGQNWIFLLFMAAGSIVGTFVGGHLLGLVPKLCPATSAGGGTADLGGKDLAA
jgi:hypothetical protein